jgi:hypothetical protein
VAKSEEEVEIAMGEGSEDIVLRKARKVGCSPLAALVVAAGAARSHTRLLTRVSEG